MSVIGCSLRTPKPAERGAREVTHLWVHEDTIIDLEIGGHDVATTEDHPFWNHTDSQWQRADALDPGDLVLTADGDTLTVIGRDVGNYRTAAGSVTNSRSTAERSKLCAVTLRHAGPRLRDTRPELNSHAAAAVSV